MKHYLQHKFAMEFGKTNFRQNSEKSEMESHWVKVQELEECDIKDCEYLRT